MTLASPIIYFFFLLDYEYSYSNFTSYDEEESYQRNCNGGIAYRMYLHHLLFNSNLPGNITRTSL